MEGKQFLMKSMVTFIVLFLLVGHTTPAVFELSSDGYEMVLPTPVATRGGLGWLHMNGGRVRMENSEGGFNGLGDRRSLRSNPLRPPAPHRSPTTMYKSPPPRPPTSPIHHFPPPPPPPPPPHHHHHHHHHHHNHHYHHHHHSLPPPCNPPPF